MQNVIKAIFLSLALAACQTTKLPDVVPQVQQTIIPRPSSPVYEAPRVMVINRQNIEQFRQMVNSGQIIIVAMTQEEFNKILETQQQVIVHIANMNLVLDQYEARILTPQ